MIYIKALLLVALLFLAITFGIQNSESVVLRYYFDLTSIPLPLYLVLYLAIILGVIAGLIVDVQSRITLRRKLKKLEKTNASLGEELNRLKEEADKKPAEEAEPPKPEAEIAPTWTQASSSESPDEAETELESETEKPKED
jgi:uncharacterized integral membrane protein